MSRLEGRRSRCQLTVMAALATVAAGAGLGFALHETHRSKPVPTAVIRVSVTPGRGGVLIPPSFLGLSMEYWSFVEDAGTRYPNPLLAPFIRALSVAGGPAQLRLGGRSTDRTWLDRPEHAKPPWAQVELSRSWLTRLTQVVAATGADVVAGLNLAAGDPGLAAGWAAGLARAVPRGRLRAFELGNEPDAYAFGAWYGQRTPAGVIRRFARRRYGFNQFLQEYVRFAAAVRAAVPGARFAGPGFSRPHQLRHLRGLIARARGLGLGELSAHGYPLRRCHLGPHSPASPSLAHLLGDPAAAGFAASFSAHVRLARGHRMPFRVSEMNSVACRGEPGLSDSLASALWGMDTLLELARAGVGGVNIHTRSLSSYSPLYFDHVKGRWSARVMPLYYALLLFARLSPPGTSVQPPRRAHGANVKVWTLRSPGATHVVVIDKQPGWRGVVQLEAQDGGRELPELTRLSGPTNGSAAPLLAGRTFGSRSYDGRLHGRSRSVRLKPSPDGSYAVRFDAPGVATLSFGRKSELAR